MTFAVISDIHSNLEALAETRNYIINREDIEETIILGDLVGYGANPNECIRLCRKISNNIILGNHDLAAVNPNTRLFFNIFAARAAEWTENVLELEYVSYLKNLPLTLNRSRYLFVHSSPDNPEEWLYVSNYREAEVQFEAFKQDICFIGHSHIPVVFVENEQPLRGEGKHYLSRDKRYIINVGSIGQPRDRNPKLSFAIFNENEWSVEYVRLDYNVKKSAGKILKAGLPSPLAERLFFGH